MRLFELRREDDESGVSGTGTVAQGVIFDNGWCALTWLTDHTSVAFYTSVEEVIAIHGHNGKTRCFQVADIDPDKGNHLCMNELQDECENVGCDFESKNGRYLWDERASAVKMLRHVDLSKQIGQ